MTEKVKGIAEAIKAIPHDVYAVIILIVGAVLAACHFKDEGMLVLGGALAVFKGKSE